MVEMGDEMMVIMIMMRQVVMFVMVEVIPVTAHDVPAGIAPDHLAERFGVDQAVAAHFMEDLAPAVAGQFGGGDLIARPAVRSPLGFVKRVGDGAVPRRQGFE